MKKAPSARCRRGFFFGVIDLAVDRVFRRIRGGSEILARTANRVARRDRERATDQQQRRHLTNHGQSSLVLAQ